MIEEPFEDRLREFRPRLHRYCARMVGSAVDGEDVVQDALLKALRARAEGMQADDVEAWLLRIAHNTCLDFLRRRSRHTVVPITEAPEDTSTPDPHIVEVSFHVFMRLPELQRCAVILKDVLGHSIEEAASIAGCTPAAAKSALQRGRATLRHWAQRPGETRVPLIPDADRKRASTYVRLFQQGDFDAIRAMLAEDVKLDLVNRLKLEGRESVDRYFTRYAEESKWRYAFGAIEGRPAMLVFDSSGTSRKPAYFVLIDWQGDRIVGIRDFLFTPYAIEAADWVLLG
ncbi:sigma-70 family RNA polymerase sigma factor [Dyella sp. EPa41]|uniref:sigma-70 family RNA polymerase sigma factor n=1 Tax=Dyella sp. EPa41 TaxID=1561194 RepID=UPI001916AE03|nr:sigma-70 family RNA polymerase sigma factor [Dyella sp. EPa41]